MLILEYVPSQFAKEIPMSTLAQFNEAFKGVRYSLASNLKKDFPPMLAELAEQDTPARITEVFAATRGNADVPSARPGGKIPDTTLSELEDHVRNLYENAGASFNYLINTQKKITDAAMERRIIDFIRDLQNAGINRITVGTPEMAKLVRRAFPRMHITMSLTRRTRSIAMLKEAEASGCNACYLDTTVNRNFVLLRKLLAYETKMELKGYGNVSCLAFCPCMDEHYTLFEEDTEENLLGHEAMFMGCTRVKLLSKTAWLQQPFILPGDAALYHAMGLNSLKLTDRLAPTHILHMIAIAYLRCRNPEDVFEIIERGAAKYQAMFVEGAELDTNPYFVIGEVLQELLIPHALSGNCLSPKHNCPGCAKIAELAIVRSPLWEGVFDNDEGRDEESSTEVRVSVDSIGRA